MVKNIFLYLNCAFLCLASLTITSCNKQDKEDPSVVILGIENADGDPTTSFEAGESVVVHVQVEDNELLNQIKLSLNGVDDFEVGDSYMSEAGYFGDWMGVVINKIEGEHSEKHMHITLSDTIQGWWEIEATALDDSGRLSESALAEIQVTNNAAPHIQLDDFYPALANNVWNVVSGQALKVSGSITDVSGLKSTVVRFLGSSGNELSSHVIDHNGLIEYDLGGVDYDVPLSVEGALFLEFASEDLDGFGAVTRLELNVSE